MGDRDGLQLVERLGHGDVENLFAPGAAGQDELHAQSRFAGARLAFDEVEAAEDEAAAEDVVQSRQPGRGPVADMHSSHSPTVQTPTPQSRHDTSPVTVPASRIKTTPGSRILFTGAAGRLTIATDIVCRSHHLGLGIRSARGGGTSDCSYICSLTRRLKGTSGGATGVPASLVRLRRFSSDLGRTTGFSIELGSWRRDKPVVGTKQRVIATILLGLAPRRRIGPAIQFFDLL